MKIISWNVNGFRAWNQKEGTLDFFNSDQQPDIFCLQETKAQPDQIDISLFPDYPYTYLHSAEKKGYSGTAIFSKIEPSRVWYGMDNSPIENEGRIINAEFENFILITVYTPNAKPDLTRVDLRHQQWDTAFLEHIKELEKKKPVIICGDLNVAHKEIDLKNPKSNAKNAGFTAEERIGFDNLLDSGFVDTFRHFHPDEIKYSWWSYMFQARSKGIGWRIDYFLVSKVLTNIVQKAEILDEVTGSDHCPVMIEL